MCQPFLVTSEIPLSGYLLHFACSTQIFNPRFACLSRLSQVLRRPLGRLLRCQSPLLATHFQPSHAAFAAPILAKSESWPIVERTRFEV